MEIIRKLVKQNNCNQAPQEINSCNETMFIYPVTEIEIAEMVKNFKGKYSDVSSRWPTSGRTHNYFRQVISLQRIRYFCVLVLTLHMVWQILPSPIQYVKMLKLQNVFFLLHSLSPQANYIDRATAAC
jgi:hypothetical protein